MPDRHTGRRRAPLALAAALLAAGLGWLWWADPETAPAATAAPAPPAADRPGTEGADAPADRAPERRTAPDAAAPAARSAAGGHLLRVRLRGVHPAVPWQAPLRLDLEGYDAAAQTWVEHEARQQPAADGTCTFALPAWVASAGQQKGRLDGTDASYLPLEHRWDGALDPAVELVVDVQITAVLAGGVVDARGAPVAAVRVSAFAIDGGVPIDRRLAQANTGDDGRYRLKVPPDVPLLVLAAPMRPLTLSGVRFTTEYGAIADNGVARADLLPASAQARGSVGQVTAVPDLVAADAARLQGVVRWTDGRAVGKARIWTQPGDGTTFGIAGQTSVQSTANGRLAPVTHATTDEQGRFELPADPGQRTQLAIDRIDGVELVGDWFTLDAVAPQTLEFSIPLPVHIRVLRAGAPVPKAKVEIAQLAGGLVVDGSQLPDLASDERGELRVVTRLSHLRLRARAGGRRSAWTTVDTRAARPVDLELEEALGELAVDFEGEFRVRNAHFAWTRDDGAEGRQSLARDDTSGPFRLYLEPGRYHLRIGATGGERNGLHLLPVERDVEVTLAPQSLTLPATFGGRFTVHATDSRGLYVAGTCRVVDAGGTDCTNQFVVHGDDGSVRTGTPGELTAGGPNEFAGILPPGDYLLEFDFREHGAQQHRVTVKPREVTDVRIRLP